ncbi:MAG TPA: flagellar export chaperone FliS [Bacillota bacterium]
MNSAPFAGVGRGGHGLTVAVNAALHYKQQQVYGSSGAGLIVILLEEGRRRILAASRAIERRDLQGANEHLIRAQDIVYELRGALNPEAGEIAANLRQLYDFVIAGLIEANVKKSAERLPVLADILETLASGWRELA